MNTTNSSNFEETPRSGPTRTGDRPGYSERATQIRGVTDLGKYLIVGILFGIVFVKAEIISWFRIQEMFRLASFHMYGVIGSAVVVGMLSVFLIKRFNIKTLSRG